jgi:hypothetical protein
VVAVTPLSPSAPVGVEPVAALPANVQPAPGIVSGADGVGEPVATPRVTVPAAAAPAAAATSAPAASARTDEQSVRAALNRYELAYTRLDAAAAASVWPGVNQRALATAFEGLSAQTISLGRCEVHVTGATARADCSGNARWTPKVGGTQSAPRQWRFDLRNANGAWVIAEARTR